MAMVSNQLETSFPEHTNGGLKSRVSFIVTNDSNYLKPTDEQEAKSGLERVSSFIARKLSPRPKVILHSIIA